MRDIAYVALGSNLGDRATHLARARSALAALPLSRLLGASSIEETAPLGDLPQRRYFNQMVALETELSPRELLDALHAIERAEGRVRSERWGPRTLDLDIVMFAAQTVDEPGLTVPHPGAYTREFWTRELAELRGHGE